MSRLFAAYRRSYAGLPREVWLLSAVMFVSRCGTMFLPYLAIFLRSEQGYTPGDAGRMLAAYGVGAVVGTYAGGWLTGRFGAVRVIVCGLTLGAPAFLVIPHCESVAAIVGVLLWLSVVREAVRPAVATVTSDFTPPEQHSRAFALNRLSMNLGLSVGAGVSGLLAGFGYTVLFGFNTLVSLAAVAVMLCVFGFGPTATGTADAGPATLAAPGPWRDRAFLGFLALQVAGGLVFFQLIYALPMFWEHECGISPSGIAVIFIINTLLIVALEMVVTDKLTGTPPLRLVAIGAGLVCLGFAGSLLEGVGGAMGPPLGGGLALACALTLVWTAGEMLMAPFGMTFVAGRGAGRVRAGYMGLNAASLSVANVLAPLVGPSLYEANPWLPWWCCLVMAAALPAGFLALERSERPRRAAREAPSVVTADAGA